MPALLLALTVLAAVVWSNRRVTQRPIAGASMRYCFDVADEPERHATLSFLLDETNDVGRETGSTVSVRIRASSESSAAGSVIAVRCGQSPV